MIRKANIHDVKPIHGLLTHFADQGLLLPRSLSALYDHLRDYIVFDAPDGSLAGVVSSSVCWEDLAEIRSLAVRSDFQNKGVGRKLVELAIKEAQELGVKKIFTLTYQPDFFIKLGFKIMDKNNLPHKIWADCVKCPHFPDCKEIALILEL